ncbi:hypothetical protein OCF84_02975 [Shewanella xiamenensis]|uniref:hypothetical protein n=1 Tax=Shewanella xiamenensis TaxID=332186 RepID=UPI00214FB394|nr:hypothetical protein [Shewanella xiamenensis]MCR4534233.1 hypothetical protein [Shewanella xiamenensis]WHF56250.1 hypothetical protein OCF84_02975 [Shewanella xiamenensis]
MSLIGVALMVMALINRRKLASLIGVLVLLPAWGYAQQAPEVSEANHCQPVSGSEQHSGQCEHNADNTAYDKFDGVVYRGVIDTKPVTLEIIGQGDRYRMTVDGLVTLGELNTERGFEQDENASLFILNWKQPEAEQIKFVKLSKDHSVLVRVDANGQLDNTAILHTR